MQPDLTLPGHPEVFVVGDLMNLDGLPGVAQVAIQSGRYAAETIKHRLAGDSSAERSATATVGRSQRSAVSARSGASAAFGSPASRPGCSGWSSISSGLTGFKNRFLVLTHWTIAFLGRGRAERAITEQQVFGRHALEAAAPRPVDGSGVAASAQMLAR